MRLTPPVEADGSFGMALGFLRLAGAPLLAICLFTCAAIAPARRSRRALLVATGLELTASAYFLVHLLVPHVS